MPLVRIAAFLLMASAWAQAQTDPLHSPACLAAVQRLTAAEDRSKEALTTARAAPTAPMRDERLQAARRDVARVCLGFAELTAPAARARPPLAVDGVGPAPQPTRAPHRGAAAAPAAAPLRPPAMLTLTNCDANGCWASDGTRLQRQGTLLLGPRGYCTLLGTVLNCP